MKNFQNIKEVKIIFGTIILLLINSYFSFGVGNNKVISISMGNSHTLVLMSDGTVWANGANYHGELGNNTISGYYSSLPVQVKGLSSVKSISAGAYHSIALKNDGTVWAWGENLYGELGNGTTTNSFLPVQVKDLTDVKSISAGAYHSIALKNDGTVWTWGYNCYGQLGNNSTTNSSSPVQVQGVNGTVTSISAGTCFSLISKSDGTVWAWGYNYYGQLGNGSTTDSSLPVQVSGLTGIGLVSAGGSLSLALKSDKTAIYAWGYNKHGELGNGSTSNSSLPVQVQGINDIKSISTGGDHSLALKSDGTLWAWGYNCYGQLGNNSTSNSSYPIQVLGLIGTISSISTGAFHSQVIINDGTVWAWGENLFGELGNISTLNSSQPVQVLNLSGIGSISAGAFHSLVLKSDKTVWAWGKNLFGELGNGTTINSFQSVQASNLIEVKSVSSGAYHSLTLKNDGTVWAWGENLYGELGNGTTLNSFQPVQVLNLSGAGSISAGAFHSLALKSDGTVWAWGDNYFGQLGNNSSTNSFQPVQVTGINGVMSISAGEHHSLALKNDGTVWAWGYNYYSQLGNDTTSDRNYIPKQVQLLSGVSSISAGANHSLALKSDGTVWAWGYNAQGELGNGTTTNSSLPVQVSGLSGVISISAGANHSLALKSDGTVWAWGENLYGELGNGTTANSSAPVQVSGLTGVALISAGTYYSLALKSNGTVWAWGDNYYGKLGNSQQKTLPTLINPQSNPPISIASIQCNSSLENNIPHYQITINATPVPNDTQEYVFYRRINGGTPECITPNGTYSTTYIDTNLTAHYGLIEYGYSTYNSFGTESQIKWGDSNTSIDPADHAPKIFVKNISPAETVTCSANGAATNSNINFTLGNVKDAEGDILQYKLFINNGTIPIKTWIPSGNSEIKAINNISDNLPDGLYNWKITCIETDANIIDRTEVIAGQGTFIIDTQVPPMPDFKFMKNGKQVDATNGSGINIVVSSQLSDNGLSGLAGGYYWIGTTDPKSQLISIPVITDPNGYDFPLYGVSDGNININLTLVDIAGNRTTKTRILIFDTKSPGMPDFKICDGSVEKSITNKTNLNMIIPVQLYDIGGAGLAGGYYWMGTTDPKIQPVDIDAITNPNGYPFSIAGVINGQVININLTLVDNAGNAITKTKTVTYITTPPNHPSDITLINDIRSIKVNWVAPQAGSLTYKLLWRNQGNTDWQTIKMGSSLSVTITELQDNQTIEIQVVPKDEAGNEQINATADKTGCTLAANGDISYNIIKDTIQGEYIINFNIIPAKAKSYNIYKINEDNSISLVNGLQNTGIKAHSTNLKYRLVAVNDLGIERLTDPVEKIISIPNMSPEISSAKILSPCLGYFINPEFKLSCIGYDWDYDPITINYEIAGAGPNGEIDIPQINAVENSCSALLKDTYQYKWRVTVDDNHGGKITSDWSETYVVDGKPPVVKTNFNAIKSNTNIDLIYTNKSNGFNQDAPAIMIYDEKVSVKTIRYKWDATAGEDNNSWATLAEENIISPESAKSISIYVEDGLNNSNTYKINCNVDEVPPKIGDLTICLPVKNNVYISSNNLITAKFNSSDNIDGAGLETIKYKFVSSKDGDKSEFSEYNTIQRKSNFTVNFDGSNMLTTDGKNYYLALYAVDNAGNESQVTYSDLPILYDSTKPVITDIQIGGTVTNNNIIYFSSVSNLAIQYAAKDDDSGITQTLFAFFSGDKAVTDWVSDINSIDKSKLINGNMYSIAISCVNGVDSTTIVFSSQMIYESAGPHIISFNPASNQQKDNRNLSGSIFVNESISAVKSVEIAIGTTSGGIEISDSIPGSHSGWLVYNTNLSRYDYIINNLQLANGTYFITAKTRNILDLASDPLTQTVVIDISMPSHPVVYNNGIYTTSNNSLYARWSFDNPDNEVDSYEYKIIAIDNSIIRDWTNIGLNNEIQATGLSLVNNNQYFIQVRAKYINLSYSGIGISNGITVDTTAPVITENDDGDWVTEKLHIKWDAIDNESGIQKAEVLIGTTPGGQDISKGWINVTSKYFVFENDIQGNKINLIQNQQYFMSLRVTNQAGSATISITDGVVADLTPPPVPNVKNNQGKFFNDYNGVVMPNADWTFDVNNQPYNDNESQIKFYEFTVTMSPYLSGNENWINAGKNTSADATPIYNNTPLIDGATYYFYVRATNYAGLSSIGRSSGITDDKSSPVSPIVDIGPDHYFNSSGNDGKGNIVANFKSVDTISGIGGFLYVYGLSKNIDSLSLDNFSSGTVSIPTVNFNNNGVYQFKTYALDAVNNISGEGKSNEFSVDSTLPNNFDVYDEGAFVSERVLRFHWTLPDSGIPLSYIKYAIVTDPSSTPISNGTMPEHDANNPVLNTWIKLSDICRSIQLIDIPGNILKDGIKYYLKLKIVNMSGNESDEKITDGIVIDTTKPLIPVLQMLTGKYCSQNLRTIISSSDMESGIDSYEYAVGTTRGDSDLTNGWERLSGNTPMPWVGVFNNFTQGQIVYFSVRSKNGAGLYSDITSSEAITIDLTPPSGGKITLPGTCNNGFLGSLNTLIGVKIEFTDNESKIDQYISQIISVNDFITDSSPTNINPITPALNAIINFNNLNLTEGGQYKVVLKARNTAWEWSDVVESPVFTVDTTPPELAFSTKDVLYNRLDTVNDSFTVTEKGKVHIVIYNPDSSISSDAIQDSDIGLNNFSFNTTQSGNYLVSATPIDLAGNEGVNIHKSIKVNYDPIITLNPKAVNVFNELNIGTKGQPLVFSLETFDPDGNVTDYSWDFNDGTNSTGQQVIHTYENLGIYHVKVTISDNNGAKSYGMVDVSITNTTKGQLYRDETWAGNNAIYGNITIPYGITLTLSPGTKVIIGDNYLIQVDGNIVANDPDKQILFTGNTKWRGILFENNSTGSLSGVTLKNAVRGISIVDQSNVSISKSIFDSNDIGIHVYGTIPVISYCEFTNNAIYGIKEDGSGRPIVNNSIFNNNGIDYYDEVNTEITIEELNNKPQNSGNSK
jgi:alpha-tubulin suppressor-like RCC1 family protein